MKHNLRQEKALCFIEQEKFDKILHTPLYCGIRMAKWLSKKRMNYDNISIEVSAHDGADC
jgi:hypothetical protein